MRLAEKYRKEIEQLKFIHLCTDAAVEIIRATEQRVHEVAVRSPDARGLVIRPEVVVLCAGGIDNSRILLWSNAVAGDRVVPMAKTLGRFWMERPHATIVYVVISGNLRSELERGPKIFFPTPSAMKRFYILNGGLRLFTFGPKPVHRSIACAVPSVGSKLYSILGRNPCVNTAVRMAWEQAPSWETVSHSRTIETGLESRGSYFIGRRMNWTTELRA